MSVIDILVIANYASFVVLYCAYACERILPPLVWYLLHHCHGNGRCPELQARSRLILQAYQATCGLWLPLARGWWRTHGWWSLRHAHHPLSRWSGRGSLWTTHHGYTSWLSHIKREISRFNQVCSLLIYICILYIYIHVSGHRPFLRREPQTHTYRHAHTHILGKLNCGYLCFYGTQDVGPYMQLLLSCWNVWLSSMFHLSESVV